jgi:heme-degrading monooxygenase HmoA
MFLLHVELKPKPGARKALEPTYAEIFRAAISKQKGFREVQLLRPVEDDGNYRLSIGFEDRDSQQQWVATDLHQEVWPQMEGNCTEYSVTFLQLGLMRLRIGSACTLAAVTVSVVLAITGIADNLAGLLCHGVNDRFASRAGSGIAAGTGNRLFFGRRFVSQRRVHAGGAICHVHRIPAARR